ncbi:MAG TPA: hypothetical protein VFB60_24085 [Ktedonobacteraceae bacterium]|nr:hypothetical protein [Ktedonobacteraceae bacterium]
MTQRVRSKCESDLLGYELRCSTRSLSARSAYPASVKGGIASQPAGVLPPVCVSFQFPRSGSLMGGAGWYKDVGGAAVRAVRLGGASGSTPSDGRRTSRHRREASISRL